ncbi:hypothetical protein DFQ26_003041 [Actinomortierella ambigua]|nr:hypothetical protein DFQ26_003041 [Actinomortierella ambigua]
MAPTLRPRDSNGRVIRAGQDSSSATSEGNGIEIVACRPSTTDTDTNSASATVTTATTNNTLPGSDAQPPRRRVYVPKELELLPPEPGMMSRQRRFTRPRHEQRHEEIPRAIATVLQIPELLDLIGQQLVHVIAEVRPRTMTQSQKVTRWALEAIARTCQTWYHAFAPHLYHVYMIRTKLDDVSVFMGLERHAHWIKRIIIETTNLKMAILGLARIHACCAVHDYKAGRLRRLTVPTMSEDGEKVVMMAKADVDRMEAEHLVMCLERNPLPKVKVGRVQSLVVDGLSVNRRELELNKLGVILRSFRLTSLQMHQFSNCAWLPNQKTVLGWWPQNSPALRSIRLHAPTNEGPLSLLTALIYAPNLHTLEFVSTRYSAVNRNPITKEELLKTSFRAREHGRQPSLKVLSLPFQFLLPPNAQRETLPPPFDKSLLGPVGLPLFVMALHHFQNLEHLVLTDIGNARTPAAPERDRSMTADDWVCLARSMPLLRILDLRVVYVPRMGIWAMALSEFRRRCPRLETIRFNAAPGLFRPAGTNYLPAEDLSTCETALLDIDLWALAGCFPFNGRASGLSSAVTGATTAADPTATATATITANSATAPAAATVDAGTADAAGAVRVASVIAKQPTSSERWCSVLRDLVLNGCRYIGTEGVLAILERCHQLQTLNIRNTRVATIQLFVGISTEGGNDGGELRPWACTDSLEALGVDFGPYADPGSPLLNAEQEALRQQRLIAAENELDAWHGEPFPKRFSTFELLQIRRRLFTLKNLQILHMGGPLMRFKIIARLADLDVSNFVSESADPAAVEALQAIKQRDEREMDSLLEHIPYTVVHLSLAHVANTTKQMTWLNGWVERLRGSNMFSGSPDYEHGIQIFTISNRGRPRALRNVSSEDPRGARFAEQVMCVAHP